MEVEGRGDKYFRSKGQVPAINTQMSKVIGHLKVVHVC